MGVGVGGTGLGIYTHWVPGPGKWHVITLVITSQLHYDVRALHQDTLQLPKSGFHVLMSALQMRLCTPVDVHAECLSQSLAKAACMHACSEQPTAA